MKTLNRLFLFLIIIFIFFTIGFKKAQAFAPNFLNVSDEIFNSAPATSTVHIITFRTNSQIPPLGKIEITFQKGFEIPSSLNYNDIDFATSSLKNSQYLQRYLATSSASSTDGVSIVSGNGGKIIINLSQTKGLHSGEWVKITIGKAAKFQAQGISEIINPTSTGSYKIYLKGYDTSDRLINQAEMMVAIINPITVNTTAPPDIYPPYRYNGAPTGSVAANTKNVSLSLDTSEWSYCRYATSAGLAYASMTAQFSNAPSLHHDTVISGLSNGKTYRFYIKCIDTAGNENVDDYLIAFTVKSPPSSPPGQGGGVAGGAPYPAPPSSPTVEISGWAYPLSKVNILKDSKLIKIISAKQDATFSYKLTNLKQGVYTFGVWATDSDNNKSITNSTTFSLRAGTNNLITFFIPPTITLSSTTIQKGENLIISGQTVPSSSVEIWLYKTPKQGEKILESNLIKIKTTSSQDGKWQTSFKTSYLDQKETYEVKVRSTFNSRTSDFSEVKYFGIGTKPKINYSLKADLNGDKKINLVDFSILLYYWGKRGTSADINGDGIVGLTDFSIMMYYWTG